MNIWSATNDWSLSINGIQEKQEPTNTVQWKSITTSNHYIGGAHNRPMPNGHVAEVLVFNSKLNDDERLKVNSYLAFKYGLTLTNASGAPIDYVASDGTPMWTAANNTGYGYRITGIGKDGALDQRQSKSEEDGALVAIALGDHFETTSEQNPAVMNVDKSFFTFSDNNAVTDFVYKTNQEPGTGHLLKRMDRVFKVEASANWKDNTEHNVTLNLQFMKDPAAPVENYYLLTSEDGVTFNQPSASNRLTINNNSYYVTINSNNLKYFTFAKVYKEDLKALIDGLPVYEEDQYTPDSWNALQTAITNANNVLMDSAATQEQVDQAIEALTTAKNGLKLQVPTLETTSFDASAKTITLTFDYPVKLTAVDSKDGFTVNVGGQVIPIEAVTVDTTDPKIVTIKLPNNTDLNSSQIPTVQYDKTNANLKGTNDNAVDNFSQTAEDPFFTSLKITEPSGNTVNIHKPEIKGTTEPGSTVTVIVKDKDGRAVGTPTVTVSVYGTWSFTPQNDLPDGDYTFEVTAEQNGKTAKKAKALTVSTSDTALIINEPSGSIVTESKPVFKGTTDPGATVTVTVKDKDGRVVGIPTVTVSVYGTWSFTPETNLPDGDYTFEITAEKYGKTTKKTKALTVSASDITLIINEPSGSTVNEPKPVFKGTTDPGATVTAIVKDKDGRVVSTPTVTVNTYGAWSFTPETNLPDGDYTFEITAEKYGKTTKKTKALTVSASDTTLIINEPSGSTVTESKPVFKGTTDLGATVTVIVKDKDGRVVSTPTVTVNADGTWSFTPDKDLADGSYTFEITATKNGKTSKITKALTVSASDTTLIINEPSVSTVTKSKPEFKGTTDPGATVTAVVKDKDGRIVDTPTVTVNPDGTWSFAPKNDLADGSYTFEVTAEKNGKPYTVTKQITISTENISALANLQLYSQDQKPIDLSPAFSGNSYNYFVNNTVTNSVYLIPTLDSIAALDPNAKIEISVNNGSWMDVSNGMASNNIPLDRRNNTIIVKVTANGKETVYTLTITKRSSSSSSSSGSGSTGGSTGGGSSNGGASDNSTGFRVIVNGKEYEQIATGSMTKENGQNVLTATVDTAKLTEQLAQEGDKPIIIIPVASVSADKVTAVLTGDAVKAMENRRAILEVQTANGNYKLPAAQIAIDRLSSQLGGQANLSNIVVHVDIAKSGEEKVKLAASTAEKGKFSVVVPPVDFTVTASYNGNTVDVDKFNVYVQREIPLPDDIDMSKITTATVLLEDGTVYHVPTYITLRDGKYYAIVSSLTNSTYTLIWHPMTFGDVEGHWSKDSVNDMASRLIVNGVDEVHYNPNAAITRAEFAAIIVRALGLPENGKTTNYSDVKSGDWFVGAVAKAQEYGIIEGYEDGAFRPAKTISREEAMAMIARAMKLAGLETNVSSTEVTSALAPFADGASVAAWAKPAVAATVKSGLIQGREAGLRPASEITRAETAAIAQRMLIQANLIDNRKSK